MGFGGRGFHPALLAFPGQKDTIPSGCFRFMLLWFGRAGFRWRGGGVFSYSEPRRGSYSPGSDGGVQIPQRELFILTFGFLAGAGFFRAQDGGFARHSGGRLGGGGWAFGRIPGQNFGLSRRTRQLGRFCHWGGVMGAGWSIVPSFRPSGALQHTFQLLFDHPGKVRAGFGFRAVPDEGVLGVRAPGRNGLFLGRGPA